MRGRKTLKIEAASTWAFRSVGKGGMLHEPRGRDEVIGIIG